MANLELLIAPRVKKIFDVYEMSQFLLLFSLCVAFDGLQCLYLLMAVGLSPGVNHSTIGHWYNKCFLPLEKVEQCINNMNSIKNGWASALAISLSSL